MINPFLEINWRPEKKDLKRFGKTMITGFTVISIIFFIMNICRDIPMEQAYVVPTWIFGAGVVIYLITLTVPKASLPIYFVWFALSACIGIVIANVILLFFFYCIFSVFAVIFRLISGRDPLTLKKQDKESYWVEYTHKSDVRRYFRQY